MKLLQLSDPHFGTTQPPVMRALQTLVQVQQPDILVLSGDITQRATQKQFRQARAFCDSLGIPQMLALPGNHDIALFDVYSRFVAPYAAYLRFFGPGLETTLDTPEALVLGVKTTRRWRHKNGEVSGAQISRVASQLKKAAPGQLRVVVVHQPVFVPRAEDEHDRLRNWLPAVSAWAQAGADVIMGGHIHLPYVRELSSAVPGLARRLWCVQAGTALSSRVREGVPNSVNLLVYDRAAGQSPPVCDVQRWDYQASASQFLQASSTQLALDRSLPGG